LDVTRRLEPAQQVVPTPHHGVVGRRGLAVLAEPAFQFGLQLPGGVPGERRHQDRLERIPVGGAIEFADDRLGDDFHRRRRLAGSTAGSRGHHGPGVEVRRQRPPLVS